MLFEVFALAAAVAATPLSLPEVAKRSTSLPSSGPFLTHSRPTAFKEPSTLSRTDNVLSLTKQGTAGSRLLRNARAAGNASLVEGTYGTSSVSSALEGQILLTSFQVGDEWFEGVLDTGSSDTWLVKTGFQCQNTLGGNTTEAYCKFGDTYDVASTFTPIPNENFRISYADGETCVGVLGYDKVTLANISVYNQTIGVVDRARWNGDGTSSGIIGLAYSALTSAFSGTNVSADERSSQVQYSPLFTSMYTQGQVESLFTLTIARGDGNSTLAIGGLPPAEPGFEDVEFTSVPIEIMQLNPGQNPKFSSQNSYYTITPDSYVYRNATTSGQGNLTSYGSYGSYGSVPSVSEQTLSNSYPTIVDSGTSLIYLPQVQVLYINAAFDPPSTVDQNTGYDVIPCNATAPEFGIVIGGTTFYINGEDMILDLDLGGGMCASGVQNGGGAVNILGDVFLRNVIAVFDVGSAEMRFAPHVNY